VFAASWMFVAILAAGIIVIVRMFASQKLAAVAISTDDSLSVETYQK